VSCADDTLERLAGTVPPRYEKPFSEWAGHDRKRLKLTRESLLVVENIRELVLGKNGPTSAPPDRLSHRNALGTLRYIPRPFYRKYGFIQPCLANSIAADEPTLGG